MRSQKRFKLTIVEEARKSAERVIENMKPYLKDVANQLKMVEDAKKGLLFTTKLTYTPPPRPATAKEIADILEKQINKNKVVTIHSDHEIIFNKKEKQLSRYVGQKKLSYKFTGGKGKRFSFFDILTDLYTPTETLREKLICPTNNAIHKLANGVNTQVKNTLKIKEKLIDGREGFGYRINPNFNIIED